MPPLTRPAALVLALGALAAAAPAQVPQAPPPREAGPAAGGLVTARRGQLPVILSAPHGGTKDVPGVAPHHGDGRPVGGSGFFAGRDTGTEELAAVEKRTGKPPYLVAARFHRRYIDANRPPDIAYDDPRAKPAYDAYRDTLAGYCREVRKAYGRRLLLDVHGQGAMRDVVIRGTKDGRTVALLRQRFGEKAHTGPDSFFGLLARNGCKVFPANLTDKEYAGLNGGNIVQTYGGGDFSIDAIQLEFGGDYRTPTRQAAQLEFGGDYRTPTRQAATATAVAAAVERYMALYLTDAE